MTTRVRLSCLLLTLLVPACTTEPDEGGAVTIDVTQSLTGQTTAAGTFALSGALTDTGDTSEELTFLGPLDQSPVPVSFRRTLTGARGTLVVTGSASLAFSSQTAAALSGTWTVESGTGKYADMTGNGSLSGSANFGAAPPSATISYTGSLVR